MSLRLHYFVSLAAMLEDKYGQCHCYTFLPRHYLKNGMMDAIQIWHVDVAGTQGVPCFKVTLNSH